MGTRNLTIVVKNQEVKIAKYSQFDGYPSYLGNKIIEAIKAIGLDRVRDIVERVKTLTQEEIEHINSFNKIVELKKNGYTTDVPEWQVKFPWASRECNGAELLHYANETEDNLSVMFQEKFAADSLFCEWCYVINLDSNALEVFRGFNTKPLNPEDRFFYLQDNQDTSLRYYPVKFLTSYSLMNLPDDISHLDGAELGEEIPEIFPPSQI